MKRMTSGISTIEVQANQRRSVQDSFKASQRETVAHASPGISVQGVPGEYDHRKFLTGPFTGMVPVQTGASGGPVVGTLAFNTDPLQWREYNPGWLEGLFTPRGIEKSSKPYYFTDLTTDPPTPPLYDPPRPVPPSKAVAVSRTTAKTFSVNLIQSTSKV